MQTNSALAFVYHKNCISTYTSANHIKRLLDKRNDDASNLNKSQPNKRSRRSEMISFDWKTSCLFCGQECLVMCDPKHPDRWREA